MKKSFRKITAVLLILLLMTTTVSALSVTAFATEISESITGMTSGITGDCTWTLDDDGTLTISGQGKMGDYQSGEAPWDTNVIQQVVIRNGVTNIGERAFWGCTKLTYIGIPNTVVSIGDAAFWFCESLSFLDLPESTETLGSGLFGYTNIQHISIPENVKQISSGFQDFSQLQYINVHTNNPNYYSVEGVLFRTQDKALIAYPNANSRVKYSIPDGTQKIEVDAFRGFNRIRNLEIPGTVKTLKRGAFYYNIYSRVTLKEGIQEIDQAFISCEIGEFIVPQSVTKIADCALGYDVIAPVKFEETKIYGFKNTAAEQYAHSNGFEFRALSVNSILESGTTGDCTWTLDYGDVLTISGRGEMRNYNKSEPVPWGQTIARVIIENGVTTIGTFAFFNCKNLVSVTIPDSVKNIGGYSFYNCQNLKSVFIPDHVTSINGNAFENCYSLTNINLPNSLKSISIEAFLNCTGLTDITIPESVTLIAPAAFQGCTSLSKITFPDILTNVYSSAFDNTAWYNNQPDGLIYIGKVAYKYKGTMPNDASVVIPDGTKAILGDTFSGCSELTNAFIPDSVEMIGRGAFDETAWFNNQPDGLVYAGKVAYQYKGMMPDNTVFELASGTKSISDSAFRDCSGLNSISIPESVISIGRQTFYNCTNLSSITIDKKNPIYDSRNNCNAIIKSANNELIQGCYTTVIPDSVTSIGAEAFSNCTRLTDITIPDSVTNIGSFAFSNCSGLTNIRIPNSITSIVNHSFELCENLTSITIPDSVTSIGDFAFSGCENLTIYAPKGSYAETYAKENGFAFVAIDDTPSVTIGDIDGDGNITISDATAIQRYLAEMITLSPDQLLAADTDGNGEVTINDATQLQKYLAEYDVILG